MFDRARARLRSRRPLRRSIGSRACSASSAPPCGTPGALGVGAAAAPTRRAGVVEGARRGVLRATAGAKLDATRAGRRRAPGRVVRGSHPPLRRSPARGEHSLPRRRAPSGSRSDSVPPLEGESPAELLAALCGRVEAAGSTAYAVDVTSPDVAELGLTVAKVVAPSSARSTSSHAARFLGGRRLYEAAAALGLAPAAARRGRAQPRPAPVPVTRVRADSPVRVARLRPGRRRRSTIRPRPSTRRRGSTRTSPAAPRGAPELALGGELATTATRSSRTHDHRPGRRRFPRLGPCAAGSATFSPGGGPSAPRLCFP